MHKMKISNAMMLFICIITSLLCICFIITDSDRPAGYGLLFLLPLGFTICSIIFLPIYKAIPNNLGATIIIALFFVRMVISPMLMSFGNYAGTIDLNVSSNTLPAILLICYENLTVFFTLFYLASKSSNTIYKGAPTIIRQKIKFKYKLALILMLIILGICIIYTPALMMTYRTIFEIGEYNFTNYEDNWIVKQYGTSFLSKLSLVTGQYLMKAAIVMVPATIIIACSKSKSKIWKWLSLLFVAVPLFFIGGAIARSLIYCVILLMLWTLLYSREKFDKRIIRLLILAGILVISWWIFRSDVTGLSARGWDQFSERFSAYFSGVNVVSGAFNMERTLGLRLRYFVYDFISTFPYGNTIFNISHETIQPFFNSMNDSMGQIPTTIGMGYYYFGILLSPIYSVIFTIVAFKAAEKLVSHNTNPIKYVRLLLTIFQFSMGIIMYNIEITMTMFWTLIFPLYLMERFAYIQDDKITEAQKYDS